MELSINGFFSKCEQIRRKLRIWSHLLKKSLMENFIFSAVKCQPVPWNSTLSSIKAFETSSRVSTVEIYSKKILKLVQGFNSNKAYGHDRVLIRMLSLCGPSIIKPLSLLFGNCL